MELEVLESDKEHIEFKLKGERHTFPELLKYYLIKNPDVEFASYKLEHPFDNDSIFILKVKKGSPLQALRDANKEIMNEINDFKEKVKDAFK